MEEWKQIDGYPQYEVSTLGQIRRGGRTLRNQTDTNLYQSVMLCRDGIAWRYRVHSLVAQAFLPPSTSCVVDHINSKRDDNRLSNLRYISQSLNLLRKSNTNAMRNIRHHGNRFVVRFGRDSIVESFSTLQEAIHYRDQTLARLLGEEGV